MPPVLPPASEGQTSAITEPRQGSVDLYTSISMENAVPTWITDIVAPKVKEFIEAKVLNNDLRFHPDGDLE
ncbi:hypothetical protein PoB_002164900 [Plakobranchus ocellatus]|uniref:Uncharacterized protein n=1 Tax=Plakobranchus ocellatus TaxID=259542 RepID=A0AAV3ZII8_9GAST|nr:hypothetical protein PoB_002164900 [Plakobranchus ocellatus]